MKNLAPLFFALLLEALPAGAAETALSALRALPKADAHSLVRIAARDGLASPEHWYFTVYDRAAASSLRVLVVAKGEVVTSEDVSAAEASGLSKELMDSNDIKVDSDQVASLALSYAAANQIKVSFLNYELARQGARAVPVWVVTCLDQDAKSLGSLVVTASRGNVVASEGFANPPGAAQVSSPVPPLRPESAGPRAAVDPRVAMSDREFLQSQTKAGEAPPVAGVPDAIPGLPPSTAPEAWAPPPRTEPLPLIAASKSGKSTAGKKGAPTPARIADRTVDLPPDAVDPNGVPRSYVDDEDDDMVWREREPSRRRPAPVFSSKPELPREVRRVRSFIHRILPF